ncbi:hypothetical protein D3C80_1746970 [compost metagenome]
MAHFTRGDLHVTNRLTNLAVTGNIVRTGRLFNEEWIGEGQLVYPLNRLVNFPDLIGVNHQVAIRSDHFTRNGQTTNVVFQITANLHLDVVETCIDGFLAQAT